MQPKKVRKRIGEFLDLQNQKQQEAEVVGQNRRFKSSRVRDDLIFQLQVFCFFVFVSSIPS